MADPRYLVVFEGESSRRVPLPDHGQLAIGRAETCEVRLNDHAVSRTHAIIDADATGVRLTDLQSKSGTVINHERISGQRQLASEDVIEIGGVSIVLHAPPVRFPPAPMQDAASFRRRLDEEIERALRYKRPLSVVTLAFEAPPDRNRVQSDASPSFRRMDCAAWLSDTELVVALPESDEAGAGELAMRLNGQFSGERCRAGVAFCPDDGIDRDVLIASARAAARQSDLQGVGVAGEANKRLVVGDQMVLVSDPAMVCLYDVVENLAGKDVPVLVWGERGTGKKLVAAALHQWSGNRMLERHVTAASAGLNEQALHNVLESAQGGTVLLQDADALSLAAQQALLKWLDSGTASRLIVASSKELDHEVKVGRFRGDLRARLSAAQLWLKPLRERPREISLLGRAFVEEEAKKAGRRFTLTHGAIRQLQEHRWPGNVRELREVIAAVAGAVRGDAIEPQHVNAALGVK
jgi:two-component system, NtrC family, response regulator AtoC